jgi:hypothetical protein
MLRDNPLFLKEIRPEFWQKSSRVSRYFMLAALALVLATPTALVLGYWRSIDDSTAGLLLGLFSFWPSFLCPALVPALIAGTIAGERERQTWDALVLTRLLPKDIIWGKLLARLFPLALLTLVLAPVAIAFVIKAGPEGIATATTLFSHGTNHSLSGLFFGWMLGLAVAFANGLLTIYISLRAKSARSALITSYAYVGGAYLLSSLLGFLLMMTLLFSSSYLARHSYQPLDESYVLLIISNAFALLWALLIPLLLLPQLINGFAKIDRKARGG